MEKQDRGLSFFLGIPTLVFLWRMYQLGLLQAVIDWLLMSSFKLDSSQMMRSTDGDPVGSAAVIADLIVEIIVFAGTFTVLSTQGVARFVGVIWTWIGEIAESFLKYLKSARIKNEAVVATTQVVTPDFNQMVVQILQKQETQLKTLTEAVTRLSTPNASPESPSDVRTN